MRKLLRTSLFVTLAAVFSQTRAQTAAQPWPTKPVRFILSQPAGSSPGIVARLLGDRLSRMWWQPVIIDNRPGGQNVIGAQAAARAPAAAPVLKAMGIEPFVE